MHNAFANTQAGFLVAQHRGCIQNALMQGIRAFMLDVHIPSSANVLLCHAYVWVCVYTFIHMYILIYLHVYANHKSLLHHISLNCSRTVSNQGGLGAANITGEWSSPSSSDLCEWVCE